MPETDVSFEPALAWEEHAMADTCAVYLPRPPLFAERMRARAVMTVRAAEVTVASLGAAQASQLMALDRHGDIPKGAVA